MGHQHGSMAVHEQLCDSLALIGLCLAALLHQQVWPLIDIMGCIAFPILLVSGRCVGGWVGGEGRG